MGGIQIASAPARYIAVMKYADTIRGDETTGNGNGFIDSAREAAVTIIEARGLNKHDIIKSEAMLRKMILAAPDMDLGDSLYKKKDYAGAAAAYTRAIAKDDKEIFAYLKRTLCELELNQTDNVLADTDKTHELMREMDLTPGDDKVDEIIRITKRSQELANEKFK